MSDWIIAFNFLLAAQKHKCKQCFALGIHNDLPEDFAAALNECNGKTAVNFGQFLLIASRIADMEQEYRISLLKTDM